MADALTDFPQVDRVFDPGLYNDAELKEILDLKIGLSPAVLMPDIEKHMAPDGIITLEPLVRRLFDLEELREHRSENWAGLELIRESCQLMLDYREQYQANKARSGKGFHPSMHTFDSRNRPRFGGIGSDSGRVRTYFSPDGKRVKFAVNLLAEGADTQWVFSAASVDTSWGDLSEAPAGAVIQLIERFKGGTGILECPICGEAETFDRDDSTSEVKARSKLRTHCKKAKNEVEAHLELCIEIDG